jgi:transcriptional regulator with XRE-family HTH domain
MAIARVGREKKANRVDAHVGRRMRLQRIVMGMSQQRVAEAGGVSFRQIQKYEHGIDRVSAASLYRIAQLLKVPVFLFLRRVAMWPVRRDVGRT